MELDWKAAELHLTDVENAYKELLGIKGVNPFFALGFIAATRERFDSGERSVSLHKEIMELK